VMNFQFVPSRPFLPLALDSRTRVNEDAVKVEQDRATANHADRAMPTRVA
jgi:hypothetical protein